MTQTTQTTDGAEPTDDLERDWIAVLAEYWRQADWDRFGGQQKSRADAFGERLEVASRAADVHAAFDKLANGLGIAVPELPTAHIDPLVENDDRAMRVLRRERVWLTNKADEAVSNYFAVLDDTEADAEPTTTDLSDYITETDP